MVTKQIEYEGLKVHLTNLCLSRSVLLNFYPKETPKIVQETNSSSSTLEKLETTINKHIIPSEFKFSIHWIREAVDWKEMKALFKN